jgi:hypothetical protein
MKILFNFFVRLLLAFIAARFLLRALGGGSPESLLGLSLFIVLLTYLIKLLEIYYQRSWQSKLAELGWWAARFLIGLNQLKDQGPRK